MKTGAEREFGRVLANHLKGELKRHGVSYTELADLLSERGLNETEASVTNKLSRGSFSAAFYVFCFLSIGEPGITFAQDETEGE